MPGRRAKVGLNSGFSGEQSKIIPAPHGNVNAALLTALGEYLIPRCRPLFLCWAGS
jgi:hypothetical protein